MKVAYLLFLLLALLHVSACSTHPPENTCCTNSAYEAYEGKTIICMCDDGITKN